MKNRSKINMFTIGILLSVLLVIGSSNLSVQSKIYTPTDSIDAFSDKGLPLKDSILPNAVPIQSLAVSVMSSTGTPAIVNLQYDSGTKTFVVKWVADGMFLSGVQDTDNDGVSEIYGWNQVKTAKGYDHYISRLDESTGKVIWKTVISSTTSDIYRYLRFVDFDGDKTKELFFYRYMNADQASILDSATGKVLLTYNNPESPASVGAFYDYNGDKVPDAVFFNNKTGLYNIVSFSGLVTKNLASLTVTPGQNINLLSDLNGDLKPQLFTGGTTLPNWATYLSLKLLWSLKLDITTPKAIFASPDVQKLGLTLMSSKPLNSVDSGTLRFADWSTGKDLNPLLSFKQLMADFSMSGSFDLNKDSVPEVFIHLADPNNVGKGFALIDSKIGKSLFELTTPVYLPRRAEGTSNLPDMSEFPDIDGDSIKDLVVIDSTKGDIQQYDITGKLINTFGNILNKLTGYVPYSEGAIFYTSLPDTTPPVVIISSPTNGATVAGTISVVFSATDTNGVTSQQVLVDNVVKSSSPSPFSLDTTTYPDGTHTIKVTATDPAGNIGSASVSITVGNTAPPPPDTTPPTVKITNPATGVTVSGKLNISYTGSDANGVVGYEVFVDTVSVSKNFGYFILDTSAYPDGSHTIEVTAVDPSGNIGKSTVTVTFKNAAPPDTTPPTVQISSPTNSSVLSGIALIAYSASDANGIASVEVKLNNTVLSTVSGDVSLDTTTFADGYYLIFVSAKDPTGNIGSASVIVQIKNTNPDKTPPVVTIHNPVNGSILNGLYDLNFTASDTNGISYYEILLDGLSLTKLTVNSYTLNTTQYIDGSYILEIRAADPSNNIGKASVQITIDSTYTSPTPIPTPTPTPSPTPTPTKTNTTTSESQTSVVFSPPAGLPVDGTWVIISLISMVGVVIIKRRSRFS